MGVPQQLGFRRAVLRPATLIATPTTLFEERKPIEATRDRVLHVSAAEARLSKTRVTGNMRAPIGNFYTGQGQSDMQLVAHQRQCVCLRGFILADGIVHCGLEPISTPTNSENSLIPNGLFYGVDKQRGKRHSLGTAQPVWPLTCWSCSFGNTQATPKAKTSGVLGHEEI